MTKLASLASELTERTLHQLITPEIEDLVARIPKPVGSFGYDPWGYNEQAFKVTLGVFKQIYDRYFRVTAHGLHNVPANGRVMLIPNHSGQLPIDGFLIGTALAMSPHGPRLARAMIERFFPTVPWLGNYLNSIGGVIGDPVNCGKLLDMDEAIIVFPEGVRGSGKLYKKRYQLQRFGTGFVHLAMSHGAPIIPVGVIGCEETMPAIANLKPIAKMLGLPYLPLLALYFPLPARVDLYFGEPMYFDPGPCTEREVCERVETVKSRIRQLLDEGLARRQSIF